MLLVWQIAPGSDGQCEGSLLVLQVLEHYQHPPVIAPGRLESQLGEDREDRSMPDLLTKLFERGWWASSYFFTPCCLSSTRASIKPWKPV